MKGGVYRMLTAKDILIFFLMELMFFEKNKFFQRVGWCSGRNHFYRNSEGVNRNLLQEFAKLVARSGRTCIRIPDPPTGKNAAF